MSKKIKTTIKEAHWKGKSLFHKKGEFDNIFTTIYYQNKDAFVDADGKLLFQMICENFFHQHKKVKLKLKLNYTLGMMYPQAYRLYMYNLIYKKLTKKKIKNDIFKAKNKELYYSVLLYAHMEAHQKRVLKIIELLNIDFKQESKRLHRVLFNSKNKKEFYITDKRKTNDSK